MYLELQNICGFERANVKIDGITVIAGNNNTGKSTIGKALSLMFNSMFNAHTLIKEYRIDAIEKILDDDNAFDLYLLKVRPYAEKIYNIKYKSKNADEEILNYIKNSFVRDVINEFNIDIDNDDRYVPELIDESYDYSEMLGKLNDIFKIPNESYRKSIIDENIEIIFSESINCYRLDKSASILLNVKSKNIKFTFENNQCISTDNMLNFYTNSVYIDNPFVLDLLKDKRKGYYKDYLDYLNTEISLKSIQEHLYSLLAKEKPSNPTFRILSEQKLDAIYKQVSTVCAGELSIESSGIFYKHNGDRQLPISNVSTGIKVFLIIKTLLLNGSLEENGTLILDEPEIHLHPEWQKVFAEIIVLLQKEFGLHILLTTHSPYFFKAIERYSNKHNITEKCNYYLTDCKGNYCTIEDVTNDRRPVYEKFAQPLQDLERVGRDA